MRSATPVIRDAPASRTTTYSIGHRSPWSGTLQAGRLSDVGLGLTSGAHARPARVAEPDRAWRGARHANRPGDRSGHHPPASPRSATTTRSTSSTRRHDLDVPPVGGGRLAGLRDGRSPPRQLVDDQRVHRQRSASPNSAAVGGVLYAAQNANQIGHVTGTAHWQTGSARSTSSAGATRRHSTTTDDARVQHTAIADHRQPNIDQIWVRSDRERDSTGASSSYVPTLTCCATRTPTTAAGAAGHAAGRQQHGPRSTRPLDLGPRAPCETGSVPFTFDGAGGPDNLINNSATPTGTPAINLTPDASVLELSSRSAGRSLTWDNVGTKKLTRRRHRLHRRQRDDRAAPRPTGAPFTGPGRAVPHGHLPDEELARCASRRSAAGRHDCDTSAERLGSRTSAALIIVAQTATAATTRPRTRATRRGGDGIDAQELRTSRAA